MESKKTIYQKVKDFLCCPLCRSSLSEKLTCINHGSFKGEASRLFLIEPDKGSSFEEKHLTGVNILKSFLKRYPKVYYLIWYIFCPVWLTGKRPSYVAQILPSNSTVINLGSGPRRIHEDFINIDVMPFSEVDIIADATKLPFKDGSLDAVVNESLLEHVADPISVVMEITRVLKPGGLLYVSTPFMTPYHGSPEDFNRWTTHGLRVLLAEYEVVEEGVDGGPWSALLNFCAYWFGSVLSFGSKKAAPFLAFAFMLVLGPLKIFDYIFARLPGSDAVAAQLYIIGRKK